MTVTVSCAWGCPFEGEVDPGAVEALCERLEGADELVLADTIGVATPRRVRRLVERVSIFGKPVGAHLHNTRNTGYASAWAALDGGATVLDASVGGLGGCPFSPNATGNVATEDLVWQLERDGVATGCRRRRARRDRALARGAARPSAGRRCLPRVAVAVTARAFRRPDDLRLLLELEQELWRASPDDVVCTFGQIAFWSAQLLHDDWEGRLWFDGEQLAGWGWLTGGTELELQVRPTHRELVDEILDWANPTELLVDERDTDLIARLNARGLVHLPAGISMRENARSLEEIEEPRVPDGYRLTTMAEYEDTASRSAAHRSAFSRRGSPTRSTRSCATRGRTAPTSTASPSRPTARSRRTRWRGSTR